MSTKFPKEEKKGIRPHTSKMSELLLDCSHLDSLIREGYSKIQERHSLVSQSSKLMSVISEDLEFMNREALQLLNQVQILQANISSRHPTKQASSKQCIIL